MRKEIVFAIIFGGLLGLVVAFGIWRVNSALSPKNQAAETQASPTPTSGFLISLAKPENNDVITSSPLEINGLTKANALVAVSLEEEDYLIKASEQGSFQETVDLVGGINQILLTAFDSEGGITSIKLSVVYSSEFKKIVDSLTSSEEPGSVEEKVEQKVEEILNKPKAYLGVISDVSETTVELKTADGEIQQVGTAEDTVFVQDGASSRIISFKDLAIGDYIIAMGFKNGNAVLNAKRVLVIDPPETLKRESVFGKVTKLTTKDFGVTFANNQGEPLVTPNRDATYLSWTDGVVKTARFSDLEEGGEVVIFGERGETSFSARTIFIVNP